MNLIEPAPIGADALTATNAPILSDAPTWSASGAYEIGDIVIHNRKLYEALKDGGIVASPELETTFVTGAFLYTYSVVNARSGYIGHVPKNGTIATLHKIADGTEIDFGVAAQNQFTYFGWHISDDASTVAFASSNTSTGAQTITVYAVATQAVLSSYTASTASTVTVLLSPDGSKAAINYGTDYTDFNLIIIDTSNGATLQSVAGFYAAAWSPDGSILITAKNGTYESTDTVYLRRYETAGWTVLGATPVPFQEVGSASFSPDGRFFACSPFWDHQSASAKAMLYNVDPWQIISRIDGEYFSVALGNHYLALMRRRVDVNPVGRWIELYRVGDNGSILLFSEFPASEGVSQDEETTYYGLLDFDDSTLYYATQPREQADRDTIYLYSRIIGQSDPSEWTKDVVGTKDARWLDLGATNPYKPFDGVVGTLTTGAEDYSAIAYNPAGESALNRGLTWELNPGVAADSLIVLGITGDYLDVRVMSDTDIELFGQRIDVSGTFRAAVFGIGLPATGTLLISVAKASGDATAGNILVGNAEYLGALDRDGLEISGVDYSIVTETPQGALDLSPGNRTARNNYVIIVPNSDATRVFERIGAVGGKKIVLVGSPVDEWALTILYGVRERWSLRPWSASEMKLSMTARGLV